MAEARSVVCPTSPAECQPACTHCSTCSSWRPREEPVGDDRGPFISLALVREPIGELRLSFDARRSRPSIFLLPRRSKVCLSFPPDASGSEGRSECFIEMAAARWRFERWSHYCFQREDRASSEIRALAMTQQYCSFRDYDSNGRLDGEIGGS